MKITISMDSCKTEWNLKRKTSVAWIEKEPKTWNLTTTKQSLLCFKKKKSKRKEK